MAETDSSFFHKEPDPRLKGWVVRQLSELRDRMKHDIDALDERLTVAVAQADRKIEEARDLLRSPKR